MKVHSRLPALAGVFTLALTATAQTTTTTTITSFAPANFSNLIFTSNPSNATGPTGTSSIYTSNGMTFNLGTGGSLVNPAAFDYTMTSPTTATLTTPASGSTPASTTDLTFTNATSGTYATTSGTTTSTGTFNLSEIPSAAALANVSVRTKLDSGESATVGFVVGGAMPRRVLIRAIGPGLSTFGVTSRLANPSLSVFHGSQMLATNDDWGTASTISGSSGSSNNSGTGSASAGNSSNNGTGNSGTGGTTGTDGSGAGTGTSANGDNSNVTPVDNNSDTNASRDMNVTSALATAQMFTQVGAFGLSNGSEDAATIVTLEPGSYTVQVRNSTATMTGTSTGSETSIGSGTSTGTSTATGSTGSMSGAGTSTGPSSTGPTSTTATTTGTSGDVLVEVYFID